MLPENRVATPQENLHKVDLRLPPKVKLHIFYSTHETGQDAPNLPERIKECDIFVPEGAGFSEENLFFKALKRIVKGDAKIYERAMVEFRQRFGPDSWSEFLIKNLYGTYKPVLFVDIREASETFKKGEDLIKKSGRWFFDSPNDFSESLIRLEDFLKEAASNQNEREDFIMQTLIPSLNNLISQHPRFFNKSQVKVLMQMGASHTRIYRKLVAIPENNGRISREFGQKPFIYVGQDDVLRKFQMGKDVSNVQIARVLVNPIVSKILWEEIAKKFSREGERMRFVGEVILRLSFEDLKNLYESVVWNKISPQRGVEAKPTPIVERVSSIGKDLLKVA